MPAVCVVSLTTAIGYVNWTSGLSSPHNAQFSLEMRRHGERFVAQRPCPSMEFCQA